MDNGRNREGRRPGRRYYDEYEQDAYSPRRPYPPRPRPRNRRPRRRRVWPALLTGCLLGILVTVIGAAIVVFVAFRASQGQGGIGIGPVGGGLQTFTHEDTTQVVLPAALSQIQVCDKIGNISIKVDPNAASATVKSKKIVHKNTQSDASQAFGKIAVEVQPPGTITNPLTCTKPQGTPTPSSTPTATSTDNGGANTLTVNVTIPDSEGLLRTTSDAVDIAITLPQKALPQDSVASLLLDIEAPVGAITVDGVSGSLRISGGTGNVKISHAVLAPGSQISTAQGNVTFSGWLLPPDTPDTNARYVLQSEKGIIDVTLPGNTNVTLDANTNVGAIHSEFPIEVNNNGGPVNYHGPLNSQATSQAAAKLVLDVSTGDVNIHKSQA